MIIFEKQDWLPHKLEIRREGGSPIHSLLVMVDQRSYLIFPEKGSENMLYKDCISLLYSLILRFLRNIQLEITLTIGNKGDFFYSRKQVADVKCAFAL